MKKTPLIIIGIVIAVAVVGTTIYFATRNNTNDTMTNMNSQSSSTNTEATDKVMIANFAFAPSNITVKKGTTVTWTNNDSMVHDVTEIDGQDGPHSGNLANGQTYTFTYNTVGTFKYHCSIHPSMTGSVTVNE